MTDPAQEAVASGTSGPARMGRFIRVADPQAGPRDGLLASAIARAKQGDANALHFLYVRYADDVYGFVNSIVRDHHEAEDITQNLFAKLMRIIVKYEQREVPFSAWILRVARNAALDHMRARRQIPFEEVRTSDEGDDQVGFERFQSLRTALDALEAEGSDVDGDGTPDTLWIATEPDADGGVPFGITTAAGGTFGTTIRSASPVARSVLVADVTGEGQLIALASDNRQVLLYGISSCSFVPELNAEGQQYAFDLGFTGFGTGVGCVDANRDGTTDLVGLMYEAETNGAGTISRTIVTLDGPQARNGRTDTVPVTRASEAEEAQTVSCGDVTLADDGVTSGP